MRCFPRKARHQWIFFLLTVCMVGVYLAYRRLLESEAYQSRHSPTKPKQSFDEIQEQLKQQVKLDLRSGKKIEEVGEKLEIVDALDDPKPDVAGMAGGRVLDNEVDYISPEEKLGRLKLLLMQLSPTDWKTAPDPDEIILLTKSEFMDLNIDSKMSCREIDFLKTNTYSQGYHGKKYIDYMKQDFKQEYVIKSVGNDYDLKAECMKSDYNAERCSLMANYKLVRELVLLLTLDYPVLIKLHGFCLRGDTIDLRIPQKGVLLVTESGRQLQQEMISMMPWNAKLEVGTGLKE